MSELERLAAVLRELADQIQRSAPGLDERRRHLRHLADHAALLAHQSHDRRLADVANLSRHAAELVTRAIEQLLIAADEGHEYATGLVDRAVGGPHHHGANSAVGSTAGAPESRPADLPKDAEGAGTAVAPRRPATPAQRREAIRRQLMAYGSDVGKEASAIVDPINVAPDAPMGAEVNDPVTAVTMTATIIWELFEQWIKRLRGG
ncbi:hypothetical protein [Haloactinopolyspora alba]|nr:hypothetical protein [Haloactinopolyspora alba]